MSINLANSRSLILIILQRKESTLLIAVGCYGFLRILIIFLDIVLHQEHHFYKSLTENWYSYAMKHYNDSQIFITFHNESLEFPIILLVRIILKRYNDSKMNRMNRYNVIQKR
jgi:hypothetical protein